MSFDMRMMTHDQAARYWPFIEKCWRKTLPDDGRLSDGNLMEAKGAFASGKYQAWLIMDGANPVGILTTMFLDEVGTNEKVFLIYTLTALSTIPEPFFAEGIEQLKRFAKSCGCTEMWTYSDNKAMVRILKNIGANTDWVQVRFDLEGE